MKMNVSEVLSYQKCPSLWQARWWARRRLIGAPGAAVTVGTAAHQLWAMALKGEGREASVSGAPFDPTDEMSWREHLADLVTTAYHGSPPERALDQAVQAAVAARAAWEALGTDYPGEVLAVEERFDVRLGAEVEAFGRWDQIRRVGGRVYHAQLKTASPGTNMGLFARQVQRTFHEALYAHAGRERWGDEYAGTLLIVLVKAPLHTQAKGEVCPCCGLSGYRRKEPQFAIWPLVVEPDAVDARLQELRSIALEINAHRLMLTALPVEAAVRYPLERREHSCLEYGKAECPFTPRCWDGVDIRDNTVFADDDPLSSYLDTTSGE